MSISTMNTYIFSHQYEGEEIVIDCCATDEAQAFKRLNKALDGSEITYHGWFSGTVPQLHIEDISHREDPVCKEYPYQTLAYV